MVAKFVTLHAVAELDVHIQHRHNAVHHPLAAPIDKSEARIRDEPQILRAHQPLDDALVVILDGTHARRLQPALVAAHTMRYLHVRGIDDLQVAFDQGADPFRNSTFLQCVQY